MRYARLITLMLLATAGVLFATFWSYGAMSVNCVKVKLGPISEYVDVQAKTQLSKSYRITMPFSARIEPITLEEGSRVSKGQLLARIPQIDIDNLMAEATATVERLDAAICENADTSVQQAQVDQGEAMVQAMERIAAGRDAEVALRQSELDYADHHLTRMRGMKASNAITPDAVELAAANQAGASASLKRDQQDQLASKSGKAAVEYRPIQFRREIAVKLLHSAVLEKEKAEANARLRQVERQKALSAMSSPIDGVVLVRHVSNECFLPARAQLLELGSLDDLEIEAEVLSQDAASIQVGARVDIYGPAVGAVPVPGSVRRIEPAAFTKTSSLGVEEQRVKVVITLPSKQLKELVRDRNLGVGFQLRVRINTNQKSLARVVPRSAVFRGAGGQWQAYVVHDGQATLKNMTIGLTNDDLAEVVDGLLDDSLVIIAPDITVTDAARVNPIISEISSNVTFGGTE